MNRRTLLSIGAALGAGPILAACSGLAPASKPAEATKPAAAATTAPAPAATKLAPAAATTAPAAGATAAPAAAATKPAAAAPTTAAAGATPAAKAPVASGVEIQVATRGASDGETMEKSVVTFKTDTGIGAKHVALGPEPEYWAKVQSLHATGQVPDVIWASTGNLHNFANRGILAELDPLIKADNYDLGDYVPNALKTMSLNGKLYGMPWGGHPGGGGLLYNIDLLEKAGIKPPDESWTLATLAEAAQKLTQQSSGRTEVFGYHVNTGGFLDLTNITGGFGGEFLTPDGKLNLDDPKLKEGLNYIREFYVKKQAPTPGPDLNVDNLFASGRIAMAQNGYWGHFAPGEKAIAGKFKWGLDITPKGPAGKRGSSLTINGQTVAAKSTKQKEAWQFVKWLMEPKNHVPIVLAGGSRPALRNSVLDNPQLNSELRGHKRFVQAIKEAEPWKMPANFRWPEFNSTVGQTLSDIWTLKATVDEALAAAKPKLQAVLDKPAID